MGKGRASVILQRSEERIGIDLVANRSQKTTAIISANIVAVRGNRAAVVNDISAGGTSFQDCVPNLELRKGDEDVAAEGTCVAGDGAVADDTATGDTTTTVVSAVPADGAVGDGRAATDPATV